MPRDRQREAEGEERPVSRRPVRNLDISPDPVAIPPPEPQHLAMARALLWSTSDRLKKGNRAMSIDRDSTSSPEDRRELRRLAAGVRVRFNELSLRRPERDYLPGSTPC